MKKGDRVVVSNPDSSFYGNAGVITEVREAQAKVFLREKKEQLVFLVYDLRKIEK